MDKVKIEFTVPSDWKCKLEKDCEINDLIEAEIKELKEGYEKLNNHIETLGNPHANE